MLGDIFEKLVDLRQQQDASIQNIERLRDEHKSWQKSFDELLTSIRTTREPMVPDQYQSHQAPLSRANWTSLVVPDGDTQSLLSEKDTPVSPEIPTSPTSTGLNALVSLSEKKSQSSPLDKLVKQEMMKAKTLSGPQVEEEQASSLLRKEVKRIVDSNYFEYVTGSVIFLNLIMIGIEAQVSLLMEEEFPPWSWPWVSERVFLLIYCIELALRFFAGEKLWKDFWFCTDACLVTVGVFALVIMPLTELDAFIFGPEKLLIVRGVRLLRLVRALRMFKHFKVMWRLINGLLTAGQTIMSTTALLLVSLFVFSCMAVELIAKDNILLESPETSDIVRKHFWGVDVSIVTLMQFVTLDSVASIYFPIISERPLLGLYFLTIIMIISIGLMNLVTAIILENAMECAAEEALEERSSLKSKVKEAIPGLVDLFETLDRDGSHSLTRDEMSCVDESVFPQRFLDNACVGSIVDFFDYLDVEKKQELTQEEFVLNLVNLCVLEMPVHAIQTLKLLHSVFDLCKKIEVSVEDLREIKIERIRPSKKEGVDSL